MQINNITISTKNLEIEEKQFTIVNFNVFTKTLTVSSTSNKQLGFFIDKANLNIIPSPITQISITQ